MAYDEILDEAYLMRAPADAVYSWLRDSHVDYDSRPAFYSGVSEKIESMLLARNDETIDLGLARWANNPETLSTLFGRWCGATPATGWVTPGTFAYPILCALLSNTSVVSLLYGEAEASDGVSAEAFDWIVEHGDDEILRRMHSNDCVGLDLIRKCCGRQGIYAAIPDERWFRMLISLSTSKRFKRPAREYDDSPDMFHWDVHRGIIDAAMCSPKTLRASNTFWTVLRYMRPDVTKDAYVNSKELLAVVASWEVDIIDDGAHSHHGEDSLSAAERVQFHLLRLYCSSSDLDPDDERRVIRLAAYSKGYLSGSKRLKIEDFKKYSDRDGPAFAFAASFNGNIWESHPASIAMSKGDFPSPEDSEYLHYNRPEYAEKKRAMDEARHDRDSDTEGTVEVSPIAILPFDTRESHMQLSQQMKSLKSWVFWAALVTIVIVKW